MEGAGGGRPGAANAHRGEAADRHRGAADDRARDRTIAQEIGRSRKRSDDRARDRTFQARRGGSLRGFMKRGREPAPTRGIRFSSRNASRSEGQTRPMARRPEPARLKGTRPAKPGAVATLGRAPAARTRRWRNRSRDIRGPVGHVNPPTNPIVQTRRRSRSIAVFIGSREPASPPSNTVRIAANRLWRCAIRRGGGITFRCG